jgi:hypothetical protein
VNWTWQRLNKHLFLGFTIGRVGFGTDVEVLDDDPLVTGRRYLYIEFKSRKTGYWTIRTLPKGMALCPCSRVPGTTQTAPKSR